MKLVRTGNDVDDVTLDGVVPGMSSKGWMTLVEKNRRIEYTVLKKPNMRK